MAISFRLLDLHKSRRLRGLEGPYDSISAWMDEAAAMKPLLEPIKVIDIYFCFMGR